MANPENKFRKGKNTKALFGTEKVLGEGKNTKKNNFLIFDFTMKNIKSNQI